jgi:hypothetical protein
MSRDDAPMLFKVLRNKHTNKYIQSGNCPNLFKEDKDFEMLLNHLPFPKNDYEILTAELRVIENEPR